MGLLLGYSILNLPTMIISCYGLLKKRLLDRRALRSNISNDSRIGTDLVRRFSRKTVTRTTIMMDTISGENDKDIPHKLNRNNVLRNNLV